MSAKFDLLLSLLLPPLFGLTAPFWNWDRCSISQWVSEWKIWSKKKTTELLSKKFIRVYLYGEYLPSWQQQLDLAPHLTGLSLQSCISGEQKRYQHKHKHKQKRYQHKFSRGDGFDLCDMCLSKGNKLASSVDAIAISKSETDPLSVNHYRI